MTEMKTQRLYGRIGRKLQIKTTLSYRNQKEYFQTQIVESLKHWVEVQVMQAVVFLAKCALVGLFVFCVITINELFLKQYLAVYSRLASNFS